MQSIQMHRSEKIADACIGQIFTTNNDDHFLRPQNDLDAQILTNLLFRRSARVSYIFPNLGLYLKDFF